MRSIFKLETNSLTNCKEFSVYESGKFVMFRLIYNGFIVLILWSSYLQVILYKLSGSTNSSQDLKPSSSQKWDYIGYVKAHTHDIRALTVAVPISREGQSLIELWLFRV